MEKERIRNNRKLISILFYYFIILSTCYAVRDLVVDNFSAIRSVNNLEGNTGTWNANPTDKSQFCNAIFNVEHRLGNTGYCLRIDYDIESVHTYIKDTNYGVDADKRQIPFTAFNGYYTQLKDADLTKYKYLIFYVKGDKEKGFTRRFKIELKDEKHCSPYIVEWLTDKWQRMVIPLSVFRDITEWKKIKEIGIVFDINVTKKVGTIYIDDIYFSETKEDRLEEKSKIVRTVKPILIDGILKEWKKAVKIEIDPDEHLETGEIADKKDLSADVWLMWDKEYLYFAVNVTDNQVISRKNGPDIWREDCIELFIDPKNDGFIWGNKKDFQIGLSPSGSDGKPQSWAWFQKSDTAGVVNKSSQIRDGGYIIEAAIKWSFLKVRPKKGMSIGVSPAVHDFDKDESADGKLNLEYNTEGDKTILRKMVLR
ncbi:MAG: hypothetical protein JW983_00815 [Elusimicrobia bacterium]|nr:hypothetical protein [Elusimicrobiota bacterium]